MQKLEVEHFKQEPHKLIFVLMDRYYRLGGNVVPRAVLTDMVEKRLQDPGKTLMYGQLYDELASEPVTDDEFRYALDELRDRRAEELTGTALTDAMEVLERGVEINKVELKGHHDARTFLYSALADIDKAGTQDSAPEGDVRHEKKEILEDYADRKKRYKLNKTGVTTGIQTIDLTTAGFQEGELIFICAYTGEGKSMLSTQTAWYCAVELGMNVFFATSETIRPQVRRRLVARHSKLPQFGLAEPLNSAKLKTGQLTEQEELALNVVVDDLEKNPEYGKLYLTQVPRGATMSFLESRLNRQAVQWKVDLVIIDYLTLLKPDRNRNSSREEYNDIIRDAKVMAVTHDNGRGVPIISPWAMAQDKYKEALTRGSYTLGNLAETSEAEKSVDQIISLLRFPDTPNEVKLQFLKNRDGSVPEEVILETDYRCSYLSENRTADDMASLLGEDEDFV